MKEYKPDHVKSPGMVLRETLEDMGVDPVDFHRIADIDQAYFAKFLSGKAPLSDELALRLEKWAKIPAWLWRRHEKRWQAYQEKIALQK